jgi:hypothetical protein
VIVTQPQNQQIPVGQNAGFSVSVTGTAPFSYQWRKSGTPINGATDASLTFTGVQLSAAGPYDVVISNSNGTVTSNTAGLVVVSGNPNADDDGDGVSNATELALGLNPNDYSDVNVQIYRYDRTNQLVEGPGGTYVKDSEGNITDVRR